MEVYETLWNGNIEDITFNTNKVSAIKWVTQSEIKAMYTSQQFYSYKTCYLQKIIDDRPLLCKRKTS